MMKQAKIDRRGGLAKTAGGEKLGIRVPQCPTNEYAGSLFRRPGEMREARNVSETTTLKHIVPQVPPLSAPVPEPGKLTDDITVRFEDGFRARLNLAAARARRKPSDFTRLVVIEAVEASERAAVKTAAGVAA